MDILQEKTSDEKYPKGLLLTTSRFLQGCSLSMLHVNVISKEQQEKDFKPSLLSKWSK